MEYGTWAGIPNLFEGAFQTFLPRATNYIRAGPRTINDVRASSFRSTGRRR